MEAILWGIIVALVFLGVSYSVGLTREAAFYPMILGAIASYYLVFAVAGSFFDRADLLHGVMFCIFLAFAIVGYRFWYWFSCLGFVLHGALDLVIHFIPDDPSPDWWGLFCLSFDLVIAISMVWFRPNLPPTQEKEHENA